MTIRCALSRNGSIWMAPSPAMSASPNRLVAVSCSQRASSACRRSWRNRSLATRTQSSYQSGRMSPASVSIFASVHGAGSGSVAVVIAWRDHARASW